MLKWINDIILLHSKTIFGAKTSYSGPKSFCNEITNLTSGTGRSNEVNFKSNCAKTACYFSLKGISVLFISELSTLIEIGFY
jgi:hypothetical protein